VLPLEQQLVAAAAQLYPREPKTNWWKPVTQVGLSVVLICLATFVMTTTNQDTVTADLPTPYTVIRISNTTHTKEELVKLITSHDLRWDIVEIPVPAEQVGQIIYVNNLWLQSNPDYVSIRGTPELGTLTLGRDPMPGEVIEETLQTVLPNVTGDCQAWFGRKLSSIVEELETLAILGVDVAYVGPNDGIIVGVTTPDTNKIVVATVELSTFNEKLWNTVNCNQNS